MNVRYDDVMVALMNDQLDYAIELIEQIKEQNKPLLIYRVNTEAFKAKPTEKESSEFNKTTDFLNFTGWEAA